MLRECNAVGEVLRLGSDNQGRGGVEHGDIAVGALDALEDRLERLRIGVGVAAAQLAQ